ncbi:hypothetical protein [Aliiruegeria sabulilitoris]|uniref:hypothetical protein n=1 Tax=Aliiruegeria sabulilitoris TaxID=1510458 RepID=UPI00082C8530|nr:hypothetical protein [Aliiruegeria sabulilitoris]NDR59026.1 hypothetical protein [Pseudoruegeria sp. M32A2M]
MSDTSSRLLRALRDLAIALINATLILVLLCLILGWKLLDRVDNVAANFARNIVSVEPLRGDVQSMTTEIAALRSDLAAIRENSGQATSEAAQAVATRLESVEARIETVDDRMTAFRERVQSIELDPEVLAARAVETAANQFVISAGQLAGCEMPAAAALKPLVPASGVSSGAN